MSHRPLVPVACLALALACTTSSTADGDAGTKDQTKEPKTSVDEPKPEPEQPAAKIAVSSVQVIQDCPDPPEPIEPGAAEPSATAPVMDEEAAPSQPRRISAGASIDGSGPSSFTQPCTQSTMQLALESARDDAVAVEIKQVRLLSKGKQVGELEPRKPSAWSDDGSYQPWDQTLAPDAPVKASYKLSLPDWSAVEKAIGESSFGHMFTLEVDVEVDGRVETVASPEFPREEPHVIVT